MVTGVLLVAMGVYIWFVAPRTRQNSALAAFTAGWGMIVVTGWILPPDDQWYVLLYAGSSGLVGPVVAVAAVVLAWDFGGREAPAVERRRLYVLAPLVFLPVPASVALNVPDAAGAGPVPIWILALLGSAWTAAVASMVLLLALAAMRYPMLARERPDGAHSVLMLTFGLGAYIGVLYVFLPDLSLLEAEGVHPRAIFAYGVISIATGLGLAGLWLRNVARSPPPFAAKARWAAWTILTAMLAGLLMPYLFGTWADDGIRAVEAAGVLTSITRFLAVGTLTYAILRNQLLGIDVKLRWTISRSTIAAAFVAVFFIASEGAQLLFGQSNEAVGLLAAGALVFAIAPLQRAAERLAAKAVPFADMSPHSGTHPHAEAYALAVRSAMATGSVTPEADRHLADLADMLGIRAGEALRLRQAVEQEVAVR